MSTFILCLICSWLVFANVSILIESFYFPRWRHLRRHWYSSYIHCAAWSHRHRWLSCPGSKTAFTEMTRSWCKAVVVTTYADQTARPHGPQSWKAWTYLLNIRLRIEVAEQDYEGNHINDQHVLHPQGEVTSRLYAVNSHYHCRCELDLQSHIHLTLKPLTLQPVSLCKFL